MQLDDYTLVLLLFIFAALFSSGTGHALGDFALVQAAASIIVLPLAVFASLGNGFLGLLLGMWLLMWFGKEFGEGAVAVGLFAFTILLLGG
jgi:hypothetical protein